ncbi:hypothetical protein Back11_02530 [Paenibacillus baekrokdamisoli]|uniref:Uncharacterized protein n=1 Tax=Paenibacillus baekrokdamisoli TaxID=1712516 RepID=A0A3G9J5C7_9BACL|nr:hypothetical protein Back11_02530 [Paenibacillus baekrokdamisoli]
MICVAESTVKDVAAVAPNVTAVAPDRFEPVNVTLVPPDVGPDVGEMLVIVGAAMYVYWSAADVADVPPVVVTLTSTVPEPTGAVAVICVAEFTVKDVAAVAPNVTAVAPDRFVPINVTVVPPDVGPDVGEMLVIVGAAMNVYWSAADVADMPPVVVTFTSTVPEPAGAVAVICVAESTVKDVAAVAPNVTAVAPDRFVPVNVTLVPPDVGPDDGEMLVIVGAAMYVNWSAADVVDVPPVVVTLTSTVPALPAGAVAVICVAEFTVKPVAAVAPNVTAVAPDRFVPINVTVVPPDVGPDVGEMLVIVGAAVNVYWSAADVADVPPGVVTRTSTVPEPTGAVAVICVAEFTVKDVAAVAPNVTAVAPDRFVPINVTVVPPDVGPDVGEMLVIVGAAMNVYWSAADVADVPPVVVTLTSTVPEPAGAIAVICVAESTVKDVAAVAPNVTAVAPDRFVPVNVTLVPPDVGPDVGEMLVIVGAAVNVYWSAADVADVPPGVVTRTSTVPEPTGAVAVICVAEFTVKDVAAVAPNVTAVAPDRFVPVNVTLVPPDVGPDVGEMLVIVGAAMNVYWSAADVADVPPVVVTLTSTVPALPAGAVAVICVAEFTVKPVAAVAPNVTAVAPDRFVPVNVTVVPPDVGPDVGEMLVIVGAAMNVYWSAADVADVPPVVVTLTSTVPEPAGAVAVICVAEFTVKPVAAVAPNVTAVAPDRFVPNNVTLVPPDIGPDVGEMPVIVGAAMNVYWSAADVVDVPPVVVTLTSTVPEPAGAVAVICVAEFTLKPVAAVAPNVTAVAPDRFVPVNVTVVPPDVGPAVGEMLVIVGAAMNVYWSAADVADVPPVVVTLTSTVPVPAGAVAVICVAEFTVKPVAAVAPNVTAVAPVRFVPVKMTVVTPDVGPAVGEMLVIVGAAMNVYWSAADVADVPPSVVTLTSTVPALPGGAMAVICVAESTVKDVASVASNVTAIVPNRFEPVSVTVVPPDVGPDVGEMLEIAGAVAAKAALSPTASCITGRNNNKKLISIVDILFIFCFSFILKSTSLAENVFYIMKSADSSGSTNSEETRICFIGIALCNCYPTSKTFYLNRSAETTNGLHKPQLLYFDKYTSELY